MGQTPIILQLAINKRTIDDIVYSLLSNGCNVETAIEILQKEYILKFSYKKLERGQNLF